MKKLIFILLFSCAIFAQETKTIKGTSHETVVVIPVLEENEKLIDIYGTFNLTGGERIVSFPFNYCFLREDGFYALVCKLEVINGKLYITSKISHKGVDAPAGIDYHITVEFKKE
jgi:hypothetical protein